MAPRGPQGVQEKGVARSGMAVGPCSCGLGTYIGKGRCTNPLCEWLEGPGLRTIRRAQRRRRSRSARRRAALREWRQAQALAEEGFASEWSDGTEADPVGPTRGRILWGVLRVMVKAILWLAEVRARSPPLRWALRMALLREAARPEAMPADDEAGAAQPPLGEEAAAQSIIDAGAILWNTIAQPE